MEEFLAFVAVVLLAAVLVIPVVSLVMVMRARARLRLIESEAELQDQKLTFLYDRVQKLEQDGVRAARAPSAPIPAGAAPASATAQPATPTHGAAPASATAQPGTATHADPASATAQAATATDGEAGPASAAAQPTTPTDANAGPASAAAARAAATTQTATEGAALSSATAAATQAGPADLAAAPDAPGKGSVHPEGGPPVATPPPRRPTPKPAIPLEERMATLFTRVGAGALVLGILYFFKYAVDNEWIGPSGRVLAGAVVGLGILVGAEVLRAKTKPGYVHALSGVGLAILYVSAYASAAWYGLVSIEVAFGAAIVILALGSALAWRYQGEAILVLVLVAGLLTPKLLSTGHDRPLALFSYLFVLTGAAMWVSAQRGFRIALGLAVAGAHALAIGWYATFFEVHDLRGETWAGDLPPNELVGAYRDLSARAVPLIFAALFGAQWMGAAFVLRRMKTLGSWIVPLAVVAAVFVHGAACALLYDHPPALGVAMLVVGTGCVVAMRALDATRWLLIPMAVAFLVLAGLSQEARGSDQTVLLVLLGLWTSVYVIAFLRDAYGPDRTLTGPDAVRTQAALLGFAGLAMLMLLPADRFIAAGVAVTLAALPGIYVAVRAKQPALLLAGQTLTLFGLLAAAAVARGEPDVAWHPAILGLAAVWAIAHAAGAIRLPAEEGPAPAGLLSAGLALLGFLALGLVSTHDQAPTLRALLTGGTGLAALGLATGLAPRGAAWTHWVSTLSALALGLFAAAVAFGLSGSPVTVLWAALAAIAGALVAQTRAPIWLVTFQVLVAATVLRILSVDVADAEMAVRMFEITRGAEGLLAHATFFNPRAYALLGSGIAFLIGAGVLARGVRRSPESPKLSPKLLLGTAGLVAVLGYGLLTALAISEVRSALSNLPAAPPIPLDAVEFQAFWLTVIDARAAHTATLDVATTVVLGFVGLSLVGAGFASNDPFHRYLGLVVLLITIGKLVTWDVWKVSRIYRVVVLTVIGALLLVSGFLYARLKVLFTGKSTSTGAGVLLLLLMPGLAHAQDPAARLETHLYHHVAPLEGATEPGDHRFEVPAGLYGASLTQPRLMDVRLTDGQDRLVPFVLRDVPPVRPSRWVEGTLYDPGELDAGGYRATFELPASTRHCEVELELSGPVPYLRTTRVETGSSFEDMQVVARGAVVYAVEVDGHRYARSRLRYPESAARWVRVTLHPDPDARLTRIQGARFACRTPEALVPRQTRELTIASRERNAEDKTTTYVLDAGQAGLPIERLDLEVTTPAEMVRRVAIHSSAYQQAWPMAGSGVVYRVAGEAPSSDLSLNVNVTAKRYYQLVIRDEDNPPLEITKVTGSWSKQEIVYRTEHTGPTKVYVGYEGDRPPSFDLEAILRRRVDAPTFSTATLGPLQPNPTLGNPDAGRALPVTERYRNAIGIALAVLVVGLGLWAIRLIRRSS